MFLLIYSVVNSIYLVGFFVKKIIEIKFGMVLTKYRKTKIKECEENSWNIFLIV